MPAALRVLGQVDRPHAAAAQLLLDGVALDGQHVLTAGVGLFQKALDDLPRVGVAGVAEELAGAPRGRLAGNDHAAAGAAPSRRRRERRRRGGGHVKDRPETLQTAIAAVGLTSLDLLLLGDLGAAVGADDGDVDGDAEGGGAEADLVAVLEVELGEEGVGDVFAGQPLVALADELAVDVGAVAAAEIADADVGRVDVEEAVVARDGVVGGVLGETDVAVAFLADKGGGAVVEDVLLPCCWPCVTMRVTRAGMSDGLLGWLRIPE